MDVDPPAQGIISPRCFLPPWHRFPLISSLSVPKGAASVFSPVPLGASGVVGTTPALNTNVAVIAPPAASVVMPMAQVAAPNATAPMPTAPALGATAQQWPPKKPAGGAAPHPPPPTFNPADFEPRRPTRTRNAPQYLAQTMAEVRTARAHTLHCLPFAVGGRVFSFFRLSVFAIVFRVRLHVDCGVDVSERETRPVRSWALRAKVRIKCGTALGGSFSRIRPALYGRRKRTALSCHHVFYPGAIGSGAPPRV